MTDNQRKSRLIDYDDNGFGRCRHCSYTHQLPTKSITWPIGEWEIPASALDPVEPFWPAPHAR